MFHNNTSPENPDIIHGGSGAAFRYAHAHAACGGTSSTEARSPAHGARGPTNHHAEHDRLLPIANVGRIMKKILPSKAKISKEAKETMQECVSEFISFVTCEASDKCHKEKRKTVNGDDICWALENLGFDEYSESLKRYLGKYREAEGEKGNNQNKGSGNEDRDESWLSDDRGDHPTVRMQGVSSSNLPFNFYI